MMVAQLVMAGRFGHLITLFGLAALFGLLAFRQ